MSDWDWVNGLSDDELEEIVYNNDLTPEATEVLLDMLAQASEGTNE